MYEMSLTRPGGEVKSSPSAAEVQDDLAASLSPERLSTYLRAVRGDREKALRLHTWNTAVSAAFYGPLQGLEVALRNAMHRQLGRCYGAHWYDNPAARLDVGCRDRIAAAKEKVVRDGHPVAPSRVLASLSFGFWIALLGSGGRVDSTGRKADYEMTLWRPALRGAFPFRTPLTRKQAHGPLDDLRKLRNRIAHHEPIFARRLSRTRLLPLLAALRELLPWERRPRVERVLPPPEVPRPLPRRPLAQPGRRAADRGQQRNARAFHQIGDEPGHVAGGHPDVEGGRVGEALHPRRP